MRKRASKHVTFRFLCVIAFLLGLQLPVSCRSTGSEIGSRPTTDLSESGNARVFATFTAYQKKAASCQAMGPGRRVMVTGFGLFAGVPYNISGVVVSSLADPVFTPRSLDPAKALVTHGDAALGKLTDADQGGRVANRSIEILGKPYQVCVLTLDTQWDLAASIILYEADRFKPDMILMSGRGGPGADIEGGAFNYAAPEPGFNPDGSMAAEVKPVVSIEEGTAVSPIIPGAPAKLMMTWDGARLYQTVAPMVRALGYEPSQHRDASEGNTYICNNVSYAVLAAALGVPVVLSGGRIRMTPQLTPGIPIGFFHFPQNVPRQAASVAAWINILAAMIDAQRG